MYPKFLLFLSLCCFLSVSGQSGFDSRSAAAHYRAENNPYYWKNRKPHAAYWQQDVHYTIKASLNDQEDIVTATETLEYWNNSPDTLYVAYFHLYQNAFQPESYFDQLNSANGAKTTFGRHEVRKLGTVVENLQQDGINVTTELDNTILKVKLNQPLLPGKSTRFSMNFKTYFDNGGNLRRRMKLFNSQNDYKHFDGVHWYPRICVYDAKFGWETDQHLGKEFYGDFGEYDVSLELPSHYILDATGWLQNREEVLPAALRAKLDIKNFKDKVPGSPLTQPVPIDGSRKSWVFHAVNVHDFAWTADPTYRIGEAYWNGIQCIALAQEEHAAQWQDAADFVAYIVKTYSEDFGMYGYPKMIAADARDGMEYPMLTLDNGSSPNYYYVIAHEIGHNWFFGMVGNNETYRAALDEGFTQFLTGWSLYKFKQISTRPSSEWINTSVKDPAVVNDLIYSTCYNGYIQDAINGEDPQLNTHSDDFQSALGHGGGYRNVYFKTATMLFNLQYVLGEDLFKNAMQHYFDQWKFCHPYFEDFRSSIIHYSKADLNWFFDQWLETTKHIDYAIKSVKHLKGDRYRITLERKGDMQMPLDLVLIPKDAVAYGKNYQFLYLPNTYFVKQHQGLTLPVWKGWGLLNQEYSFELEVKGGIRELIIDPSNRLADTWKADNNIKPDLSLQLETWNPVPNSLESYRIGLSPDIWYNNLDGLKLGININGGRRSKHHVFNLSVWYNSLLLQDKNYTGTAPELFSYHLDYKTQLIKNLDLEAHSRRLDGVALQKLGLQFNRNKTTYYVNFKSIYHLGGDFLAYNLGNPNYWAGGLYNNTINLGLNHSYGYSFGSGEIRLGYRSAALYSDYAYHGLTLEVVNENRISKFDWRTRVFAQFMDGSAIAGESKLWLSGANGEQLLESKYTRAGIGPVPEWSTMGLEPNHFQMGGGLNLRAYTGYWAYSELNNNGTTSIVPFQTGNSGASFSTELDFDRFIPIHPKLLRSFHLDPYLFFDAGIMMNPSNTRDFSNFDLRADAGAGFALTWRPSGLNPRIQPLTIRVDVPLWLSNLPPNVSGSSHFRPNWLIGINRSF